MPSSVCLRFFRNIWVSWLNETCVVIMAVIYCPCNKVWQPEFSQISIPMTPFDDIDRGQHWLRQCCVRASSHYLSQCWLTVSEVPWHSLRGSISLNLNIILISNLCLKAQSCLKGDNVTPLLRPTMTMYFLAAGIIRRYCTLGGDFWAWKWWDYRSVYLYSLGNHVTRQLSLGYRSNPRWASLHSVKCQRLIGYWHQRPVSI